MKNNPRRARTRSGRPDPVERYGHEVSLPKQPAQLLDKVLECLMKYVVYPSLEAAVAVTLWVAATHAQRAWENAARLVFISPLKQCGKTRALETVSAVAYKPIDTADASVAAIFRSILEDDPPTLLIDEADAKFGNPFQAMKNDDLRALINAGHRRGKPTLRCDGPNHEPREFPTFCMVGLAAISYLPSTIMDRSVVIPMQRRRPGEHVEPYRSRDAMPLYELGAQLYIWVNDNLDDLRDARPELPVEDRAADVWEPLVAIADLAGGDWPKLARQAAQRLTEDAKAAEADQSLDIKLLSDLRDIFNSEENRNRRAITTGRLVVQLCDLRESPWGERGLDARELGQHLRPFGVRSQNIRMARDVRKGYRRSDLLGLFERYLPPPKE